MPTGIQKLPAGLDMQDKGRLPSEHIAVRATQLSEEDCKLHVRNPIGYLEWSYIPCSRVSVPKWPGYTFMNVYLCGLGLS
jgi:hypothetical protein